MSGTGFYYSERCFSHCVGIQAFVVPLPADPWVQPTSIGADTPESKRHILALLTASGLLEQLVTLPESQLRPASMEELGRVHTDRYLRAFKDASDKGAGDLGDHAPFGKGGFEIAQLSAGLAIAMVEDVWTQVIDNGYALCRPAGHHCLPDRPMGFCLFANIPVAIDALKVKYGVERIAVVDWDVHHGNGTQHIYYGRGDVLTLSLHQDRCFPPGYSGEDERGEGAGLGANINIPLPAGSGHEAYVAAVRTIVVEALERFRPEIIIVASGLDANAVDPLGRQLLHSETYREMTQIVLDAAKRLCGGRLALCHEGGYAEAYTPYAGFAILEALSGVRTRIQDRFLDVFRLQQPNSTVVDFQLQWVERLRRHFGFSA